MLNQACARFHLHAHIHCNNMHTYLPAAEADTLCLFSHLIPICQYFVADSSEKVQHTPHARTQYIGIPTHTHLPASTKCVPTHSVHTHPVFPRTRSHIVLLALYHIMPQTVFESEVDDFAVQHCGSVEEKRAFQQFLLTHPANKYDLLCCCGRRKE